MKFFLKRRAPRRVPIGWLVDAPLSTFVWQDPEPVLKRQKTNPVAKHVNNCPAVIDLGLNFFKVLSPFSLHLRLEKTDSGSGFRLHNVLGNQSEITEDRLKRLLILSDKATWRSDRRPIIQLMTPYRFICDEPVIINQLPPFLHYHTPPLPGVMIGGRFPANLWPRLMMWAFEWFNTAEDLIVKKRDPLFYIQFDLEHRSQSPKLVHAQMTESLRTYCRGLDGVTDYTNQTYALFKTAKRRRPKQLLTVERV